MILGKKDKKEFERLKQFERDFSDIYWLEMPFLKPFIHYVSRKEMISIETARNRVRREFDVYLKEKFGFKLKEECE